MFSLYCATPILHMEFLKEEETKLDDQLRTYQGQVRLFDDYFRLCDSKGNENVVYI